MGAQPMKNMKLMKYFSICLLTAVAYGQSAGRFGLIARYRGLGGLVASMVGPGPTPRTQRIYASYLYFGSTLEVVAINPKTGSAVVFQNPAKGEFGARNITVSPHGNIYLGTLPHAHFLKLDVKQGKLIDLGRPSPTEQYIWDVTFGSDDRLYGVTYPNCKLVRYDPATGQMADLGRLDHTEEYAETIVASRDGFLYIGIGTSKANIAAYNIRTGQHREILPPDAQAVGTAKVYRGQDGKLYGSIGNRVFLLSSWTAKELKPDEKVPTTRPDLLRDGWKESLNGRTLTLTNPKTHARVVRKVSYGGRYLALFRIGFGPNGHLYGSGILPIHFVKVDLVHHHVDELGNLGGGEVYSFLSDGNRLLMGLYAGLAPLMAYDPAAPMHPATNSGNPALVNFPGADGHWRPQAMIDGRSGKVYIGAVAGYGKLQEPLIVWDVKSGAVQLNGNIIHDQSIISLAKWHGLIIGGSTIEGGGGSHPTQKEARLFIWNPRTHRREFDIVPVPGASCITDLTSAPNGMIYGVADGTFFVFDPATLHLISRQKLPFSSVIYNSVGVGKGGKIWGLARNGIFTVDPKTNTARLIAHSPEPITGGFALRGGAIYFLSGSAVYRYKM